jgi:hypothetical protein
MSRVSGAREPWRVARLALAAGIAAISVLPLMADQTRTRLLDQPRDWNRQTRGNQDGPTDTETVERNVPMPNDGTVRIRNFSGEIRVVAGSGRNVVVKAIRRAPRERLDRITLDVTANGSIVTVDANHRAESDRRDDDNVVETQMTVEIPPASDLDVNAFSSDVTVDGLSGDQRIKTFSGAITVQNLQGEIDAQTFSADIRVTLAADARGDVSFRTFSGQLDSNVPIAVTSTGRRRNNVEGTLKAGGGPRLRFHTFSGDVELTSR